MKRDKTTTASTVLTALALVVVLYFFFVSIELMSSTFKLFGKGFAESLIKTTSNPLVGLFIGILATSLIQSSSTSTSIVVGLVASQALNIENAIPIVMGANVGTSVTNTLVSMGHITRREEFQRAVAGATVHDFFNLMSVAVLLPLELATGFLSRGAAFCEHIFEGVGGLKMASPLKMIISPASKWTHHFLLDFLALPKVTAGIILLVVALALLFFTLKNFVVIMRRVIVGRVEQIIHTVLFKSAALSFLLGMGLTVLVQSSSITTSLIVPMIGAGILTVAQFYPYTLGANIGTTVTAIMASLATANPAAITVAFAHLLFNITGCVVFYPLRWIPIKLSHALGKAAAERRSAVFIYIGLVFFVIPLVLIFLTR